MSSEQLKVVWLRGCTCSGLERETMLMVDKGKLQQEMKIQQNRFSHSVWFPAFVLISLKRIIQSSQKTWKDISSFGPVHHQKTRAFRWTRPIELFLTFDSWMMIPNLSKPGWWYCMHFPETLSHCLEILLTRYPKPPSSIRIITAAMSFRSASSLPTQLISILSLPKHNSKLD